MVVRINRVVVAQARSAMDLTRQVETVTEKLHKLSGLEIQARVPPGAAFERLATRFSACIPVPRWWNENLTIPLALVPLPPRSTAKRSLRSC